MGLSVLMGLVTLSSQLFAHRMMFEAGVLGSEARTVLGAVVYDKSLYLAQGSLRQFSVGNITNLIVNDANRVQEAVQYSMQLVWAIPQGILVLIFLYAEVGMSSLIGLAVLGSILLSQVCSLLTHVPAMLRICCCHPF